MRLTLPEEVLLLLLHDDKGTPMVDVTVVGAALAGAAVVELTLDGVLRLAEGGDPQVRQGRLAATGRAVGDDRLAPLVELVHGRRPKDAITKVSGWGWGSVTAKNLREGLLHDLAAQGLLSEERGRVLGIFPTTSWPQGPTRGPETDLVERVRRVAVGGADPDPRTAALVAILHAAGALPKVFPDADRKELKRRGKQVSEGDWAGQAVRAAIREVQASMVAIMASAASVSATST